MGKVKRLVTCGFRVCHIQEQRERYPELETYFTYKIHFPMHKPRGFFDNSVYIKHG